MNRRKLLEMTGLGALASLLNFWPARAETSAPTAGPAGARAWVGEGRVLPISRMTSDFRLFAADRVHNYLLKLRNGHPVKADEIAEIQSLIIRYWVKPVQKQNYNNEMEWREKEMRRLGWTEHEIEKAQAHYAEFHKC